MRTIDIRNSNPEAFVNFYQTYTAAVQGALNYLTTWALPAYQYVDIYVQLDGEMTACYYRNQKAYDDNERPGYVLGAIFHEASADYSFHS